MDKVDRARRGGSGGVSQAQHLYAESVYPALTLRHCCCSSPFQACCVQSTGWPVERAHLGLPRQPDHLFVSSTTDRDHLQQINSPSPL